MKTSIELLLSELNNSFKKINNDIHTDDSFNILLSVEVKDPATGEIKMLTKNEVPGFEGTATYDKDIQ